MRLAVLLLPLVAAKPLFTYENIERLDVQWAFDAAEDVVNYFEDDKTQQSIWQQIKDDEKYSKLVKILKFEEDTIKDIDNTNAGYDITFFAPNNDALKPPHHGDGDDDVKSLSALSTELESNAWLMDHHHHHGGHGHDDDDDDKKKKRRKRILKKIAHAVLQYHILPQGHSAAELAQNSTMATALHPHDGSSDGLHRRVHLQKQLIPPAMVVNFYAKVQSSEKARNGYLHELDHPLLPPGSIFDELFLSSKWLSTSSSAIQRVGGRHYVDWGYDHEKSRPGKPKFSGTPLATFFAPSNDAWNELPEHLHFFLFSRFGIHVLGKLLAYHYVPHTLVLSEVVHHAKHDKKHIASNLDDDDPSFHREIEVPSGLGEKAKLKIVMDKVKVLPVEGATKTTIKVNDQDVKVIDIPASNGAWHIIDKVLCPPHHHKKKPDDDGGDEFDADPWADWETWLPQWAAEQ